VHLAEMLLLPADPLTVAHLLADRAFVSRCLRATGATPELVEVTGSAAGAFAVSTRRGLPADQVPAQLRGFVGAGVVIAEVARWGAPDEDDARAGTVNVDVVGLPVQLRATATLVAHGSGTSALRYAGDLRAAVPLVGDAVERAVAEAVRHSLRVTADVAEQVLRPDRPGTGAGAP
jgi:hypothetical protein